MANEILRNTFEEDGIGGLFIDATAIFGVNRLNTALTAELFESSNIQNTFDDEEDEIQNSF